MDLYAGGQLLNTDPEHFGLLQECAEQKAGSSLESNGYALMRDFFSRESVLGVRKEIALKLEAEGHLQPGFSVEQCVARPGSDIAFRPDISNASTGLRELIYSDKTMRFFSELFGGEARHYDFTWLRVVAPGKGTFPHCDIVYMGRGTRNIVTMWVPYGDIPLSVGGLLVLENSHRLEELHQTYGRLDVDSVCQTSQNQTTFAGFEASGAISNDFISLQQRYGGRWLSANFLAGDALIFGMQTIHGSLDNGSDQIRISSDSRYQLASEPIDERWIGDDPIAHGSEAKQNLIC
jgi:ectoine hydroxylase-related dioxygenase (phytanoyl-CoA dioxygenase family)